MRPLLRPAFLRRWLIGLGGLLLLSVLSLTSPGTVVGDQHAAVRAAPLPDAPVTSRPAPADFTAEQELVSHRTANSATFQRADGVFTTVLSTDSLHYRDDAGAWQPIDPAFATSTEGFAVEHNSIQSQVGLRDPWLAVRVGDSAAVWEATALGSATAGGFMLLAEPTPDGVLPALDQDGRLLNYRGGWTDPTLSEHIISAPDSIEHALVLAGPPAVAASADYLELQATLDLLPGSSLWAKGGPQATSFTTTGAIEVRDETGRTAFVFEPVVAYEAGQPHIRTAGLYVLEPGAGDGSWLVKVRTPFTWWTDPQRAYPAVLDPTIRVLTPTIPGENGLAWIGRGGPFVYNQLRLGAHLPNYDSDAYGYIQFNALPAILTNNSVMITQATLQATPRLYPEGLPLYSNSKPDWEHKSIERGAQLTYVGACPGAEGCPGNFDLSSGALPGGYTYDNSPKGQPLVSGDAPALKVGPASKGGQGTTAEWDVTDEIEAWYVNHWAQDATVPTFRLGFEKYYCTAPGPYTKTVKGLTVTDTTPLVPRCIWLDIQNVTLDVTYSTHPVFVGDEPILNRPGVPSYLADVFPLTGEYDTDHAYSLAPNAPPGSPPGPHWRVIAVRGNHDLVQTVPTRVGLRLREGETELGQASANGPDKTVFMLTDGHNTASGIAATTLTADITASSENDFANDIQRNYRLQYEQALPLSFTYGQLETFNVSIASDQLVRLFEFDLMQGDTVMVTANGSPEIELALIEPTNGSQRRDGVVGNDDNNINANFDPPGATLRTLTVGGSTGKWALLAASNGTPAIADDGGDPTQFDISLEILVCPEGTIATKRYLCQPLRMPQSPLLNDVALPSLGITVHAPEFAVRGSTAPPTENNTWCTANEGNGAPLIEKTGVANKYVAVGQGSICYNGATKTLSTTPESGLVLAVPLQGGEPHRGDYASTRVYGSTAFDPLPAGQPHGIVQLSADTNLNRLVPRPETRRMKPFEEYWGANYQQTNDYIDLNAMKVVGIGQVNAEVTIEAGAAQPVTWLVPWTFRTDTSIDTKYRFEVEPDQQAPLPSPLDLASADLHLFSNGFAGGADGIVPDLLSMLTNSGPTAYQFHAPDARLTNSDLLGGATKYVEVIVMPPGKPRLPDNKESCGTTSCLDLRRGYGEYDWQNGDAKKNVQPWELPDVFVTDQIGTVTFAADGVTNIYSVDHPLAGAAADAISQGFAFETWEATATVSQGQCTPGGPIQTIIHGAGKIALPMIGDNGSGSGPYADVAFTLCETALREASLSFGPIPGVILPVGSTGLGIDVIGGSINVGPKSTRVVIDAGVLTVDGGVSLSKDGLLKNAGVTIDTAGLFSLQATGEVVQALDANFKLDVAWDPLDVLLEGEVSYGGGLLAGFLRLHGWIGQGWQAKYAYLPPNNDFHFTGTIKATVSIKKGQLIDEKYLKVPWFNAGISAEVAFGEFCSNKSSCLPVKWGMSATVKAFGYGIGVYVDSGGPEIFLGSSKKVLVDQCTSCTAAAGLLFPSPSGPLTATVDEPAAAPAFETIIEAPGQAQANMTQSFPQPFAGTTPITNGSLCTGYGTTVHTCTFDVAPGTGRAMISTGWLNGQLNATLLTPAGQPITPANAATAGVTITPYVDDQGLHRGVNFAISPATPSGTIPSGAWKIQLSGISLDPALVNHYSLAFAADPPAPSVEWQSVLTPNTLPVGGVLPLKWKATRAGAPLESDVTVDLFYAPVYEPPIWQPISASFPGDYMTAAGLGANDDPADPDVVAADPNQDGVWTRTISSIPAGEWTYRVARNGAWEEYYGLSGVYHGEPISFTVAAASQPVTFYYDPRDNFSTTNTETQFVTLVGNMMSEIGGADWTAANLVGWMKPGTEQATLYETTLEIPAGNWQYRVALNENNAQTYGAGGVLNGPALSLSVPAGDALVRFVYDDESQTISHEILATTPGQMITRPSVPATGAPLPNTTSFNWPTGGLAVGEYRVGLRVADHFHGNGTVVSWAPGTVLIQGDVTPPPVPVLLPPHTPVKDGLIVRWQRDDVTPDLAGYLIEYEIPATDPNDPNLQRTRRMVPLARNVAPLWQHVRLGGLLLSDPDTGLPPIVTAICVRAHDVNGNVSGCNAIEFTMPIPEDVLFDQPLGPPRSLTAAGMNPLTITWNPPTQGVAAGYLLSYAPAKCLTAESYPAAAEGLSPIHVGNALQAKLHGLVPDQVYAITVRAYAADGELGPPAVVFGRHLNMADNDGDGLPDAWTEIYGSFDPQGDVDQDGVNNRRESVLASNPFAADSDGDDYYDGEEVAWETDVCGPETPPYHAQPHLTLTGASQLSFDQPVNFPLSPPEVVTILNTGAGDLAWAAKASAGWIKLSQTSGTGLAALEISADGASLAPGTYQGTVTISSQQTAVTAPTGNVIPPVVETYTIPVKLTVLPAVAFDSLLPVIVP